MSRNMLQMTWVPVTDELGRTHLEAVWTAHRAVTTATTAGSLTGPRAGSVQAA